MGERAWNWKDLSASEWRPFWGEGIVVVKIITDPKISFKAEDIFISRATVNFSR